MPVYRLIDAPVFPDPRDADGEGLLAVGGDLSIERLLQAYAQGIFPWYSEGDPILWWSPPERALILPGQEHLPVRAQRALRRAAFELRADTVFERVIERCARIPRGGQRGTWITDAMARAYGNLHREGFAHSIETWENGELVGGLYGLSLGAAFFGESMFSDRDYASRAAFAGLCGIAKAWDFHFIDGQLPNANLLQLGAVIVPRHEYLARLATALTLPTRRGAWTGHRV
jgi:leucyl/phenylalanyl-tRNA--protein transferase